MIFLFTYEGSLQWQEKILSLSVIISTKLNIIIPLGDNSKKIFPAKSASPSTRFSALFSFFNNCGLFWFYLNNCSFLQDDISTIEPNLGAIDKI